MTTIVNEFIYDTEKIKEGTATFIKHRVKKDFIGSLFGSAVIIILSFIFNKSLLLYFGILLPIVEILIVLYKIKVSTNHEINQFSNANSRITLNDKIIMEINDKKKEFEYQQIVDYVVTKNLIILNLKEYAGIVLSKTGFVSGSYGDLIKLLDEKIKA